MVLTELLFPLHVNILIYLLTFLFISHVGEHLKDGVHSSLVVCIIPSTDLNREWWTEDWYTYETHSSDDLYIVEIFSL